jgi:hypothetical protein
MADEYGRYEPPAAFAKIMERRTCGYRYSDEPLDRLVGELRKLAELLEQGFDRETLPEEITRLQLYAADVQLTDLAGG